MKAKDVEKMAKGALKRGSTTMPLQEWARRTTPPEVIEALLAPAARSCAICDRTNGVKGPLKMIRHHVQYSPEVVIDVCAQDHEHLHGRQTFNDYFEKVYGKDFGPYAFAMCVQSAYESAFDENPVGGQIYLVGKLLALKHAHDLKVKWDTKSLKQKKEKK